MTKLVLRRKPLKQHLEETYGGTWEHVGPGRWKCDDGRTVGRTCGHVDDSRVPAQYWLYGDGPTKRVDW